MKKTFVQAVLSLLMLIVLAGSVNPSWIQTNWPASSIFFRLYANQDTLFARTWDSLSGGSVFLTADEGENWSQISSADRDIDILSIVMWNTTLLAGTWEGFYLSTNNGETWNAITPVGIPEDTTIWSIAMLDTTLYAGTQGIIYQSSDDGATWIQLSSGIPADARITSIIASGDALFVGCASHGVLLSTNEGASWKTINSGITDLHISQLITMGSRLFAVTLNGVFFTDNNGTSWSAYHSDLDNINCFVVVDDQLFAGTDADGVYLSIDSGLTWMPFSSGLPADTRVWSMIATSHNIFAGTDSGVWRFPMDAPIFTINASALAGGTISPEGDIVVYQNDSLTFVITPGPGYVISDVLVDGASQGPVESYTFSNITAHHSISASFQEVSTEKLGDINHDGLVNSTDALIALSADVGMDTTPFCPMNCGDANQDGFVNSTDALIILSFNVGMTVPFPVNQPGCPSNVTPPPGCAPETPDGGFK